MTGPTDDTDRINQEQICLIVGLFRKSRNLLPLLLAVKQRQETILFRLGNSAAHTMHNHGSNKTRSRLQHRNLVYPNAAVQNTWFLAQSAREWATLIACGAAEADDKYRRFPGEVSGQ